MEASCHSSLPFISPWVVIVIVIGLSLATSLCKHSRKVFDGYEPIFIVGHSNVDNGTKYDLLVVNLINTYMCRRESCSIYTTGKGSNVKAKENS